MRPQKYKIPNSIVTNMNGIKLKTYEDSLAERTTFSNPNRLETTTHQVGASAMDEDIKNTPEKKRGRDEEDDFDLDTPLKKAEGKTKPVSEMTEEELRAELAKRDSKDKARMDMDQEQIKNIFQKKIAPWVNKFTANDPHITQKERALTKNFFKSMYQNPSPAMVGLTKVFESAASSHLALTEGRAPAADGVEAKYKAMLAEKEAELQKANAKINEIGSSFDHEEYSAGASGATQKRKTQRSTNNTPKTTETPNERVMMFYRAQKAADMRQRHHTKDSVLMNRAKLLDRDFADFGLPEGEDLTYAKVPLYPYDLQGNENPNYEHASESVRRWYGM